ncbi:MAG: hypothetical protein K2X66_07885, partial [Cyanobacteria bacterium]|nr:hypothetical protein [Cyanobacteriota bacterium]
GFTSALNQAYKQSGFPVIESPDTMPVSFLKMLQGLIPEKDRPENRPTNIAIILSDEAMDYQREMMWLTQSIQSHYPNFYLIHPNQVELVRDQLVFKDTDGEEKPIDLIYRFFELFDLANIPKIELIQYAIKKGFVACTPPFKPHTEEKLTLALLHHPSLTSFWKSQLGENDFQWLKASVPAGWILDPSPLPPQGVIPGLSKQGQSVQSFQELMELTQKERELIIKPSGFSPLAWGGRGVTVGHDIPLTTWQESLQHALEEFSTTPYILQEYRKPAVSTIERLPNNEGTGDSKDTSKDLKVRTRLCPYFFIEGDTPILTGILATSCPQDKKVIHGMKDAVISPCWVEQF